MAVLKDKLELSVYDQVREALGLEPMKTAVEKGKNITNKIRDNIEK
jgi:hypothetical protein